MIPSFTRGRKQLIAEEIARTRKMANVCIHVEHVIGNLLKNRFGILSTGTLPSNLTRSKTDEVMGAVPNIKKLVTVCSCLINLSPSIVYSDEENKQSS